MSCPAIRPAACCRASAAEPPGEYGAGDRKVQAYCFRMCLTDVPENRVPFPKPEGYDPRQYELLLRIFDAGWRETFDKFDPDPESQDRHEQPRPVQHRQHRLQLRLSGGLLRAPARDHPGTRDVPEGLAVLHRQRSARAGGCADQDEPMGAWPRTSSPTTATGRIRSTSAKRGG